MANEEQQLNPTPNHSQGAITPELRACLSQVLQVQVKDF
jgi:hypothetical protein